MASLCRTIRRSIERERTGGNHSHGRKSRVLMWKVKEAERKAKKEHREKMKYARKQRKEAKTSIHKKV